MGRKSKLAELLEEQGRYSITKKDDVYYVKKRSGLSADDMKLRAAFHTFRKNGHSFTKSANASKFFRDLLHPLLLKAPLKNLHPRLVKFFRGVVSKTPEDLEPGIAEGIRHLKALSPIDPLLFSDHKSLTEIIGTEGLPICNEHGIFFNSLVALPNIIAPEGTTHLQFTAGRLSCNFATREGELTVSKTHLQKYSPQKKTFLLELACSDKKDIFFMDVLLIEFFSHNRGERRPIMAGTKNFLAGVRSGFS